MKLPKSLERAAAEVEGWLELGCPEIALEKMQRLLDIPGARPAALMLQVRALMALNRHLEALDVLDEVSYFEHDPLWLDIAEGACRKRTDDLGGAIRCMERLLKRDPRAAIGHFNLGCYLSLAGDLERAIDEVSLACGMDESYRALLTDADLDALRDDPRFQALLPRTNYDDD